MVYSCFTHKQVAITKRLIEQQFSQEPMTVCLFMFVSTIYPLAINMAGWKLTVEFDDFLKCRLK